ncbi:hypothetical protein [Endozoicomonas atrinae]|uniref:hypothetical protein n=1 Tax=Endozoicomonas atrinae TaxID=1333660 RepID=UPI000B1B4DB3|nr:hypothetical protein [Endozoicomonas atrinae]
MNTLGSIGQFLSCYVHSAISGVGEVFAGNRSSQVEGLRKSSLASDCVSDPGQKKTMGDWSVEPLAAPCLVTEQLFRSNWDSPLPKKVVMRRDDIGRLNNSDEPRIHSRKDFVALFDEELRAELNQKVGLKVLEFDAARQHLRCILDRVRCHIINMKT